MNEVLQNIMTFINENTYLLIGICVFLIFVLIGYLIDNSVKSKRVRKDIKNKDQVPEEIKNEIIKEAINENKEKMMENSFHNAVREESTEVNSEEIGLEDKNTNIEEPISMELNFDEVSSQQEDLNSSLDLSDSFMSEPFSLDNSASQVDLTEKVKTEDNIAIDVPLTLDLESNSSDDITINSNLELKNDENIINEPLTLDVSNANIMNDEKSQQIDNPFALDINTTEDVKNEQALSDITLDIPTASESVNEIDPDINIMNVSEENSKYKNDMKLSEILLNVDKERVNSNKDITLDESLNTNIEVNSEIENEKVEIEANENSSDELDKIMKKLSAMNNDEEDNYTNIF